METRTPEMRKWIMEANEKEFRGFLVDKIYDNKLVVVKHYEELKERQEEDSHVTLINGDKRRIKTNIAVAEMYDDIKEIKIAVVPLVDFATLHRLSRKYKIYYMLAAAGTFTLLENIWHLIF